MSFTSDIRKIVLSSGRNITEDKIGSLSVFSSDNVSIVSVPIISKDFEQAQSVLDSCADIRKNNLDKGIETIFILQDRFVLHPDAMTKRILSHLGKFHSIFARNCEVRRIDKVTAMEFLEDNHSYGDAACKYRYGLYVYRYSGKENKKDYEGEHPYPIETLVAVAEFSNARKWKKGDKNILSYEWIRYASVPGVRVVGGMGKMLSTFIEEVSPDDLMSYADLEWSDGRAYRELGFEEDGLKDPVDFWIDPLFYTRIPVLKGDEPESALCYRNFGSLKYRLKLTDY